MNILWQKFLKILINLDFQQMTVVLNYWKYFKNSVKYKYFLLGGQYW